MVWRAGIDDWQRIKDASGAVLYVGKGSGGRVKTQAKRFSGRGEIVMRFAKEADAYAYEIAHIASVKPSLNKHPGGNGSRAVVKRERKLSWEVEMDELGPRRYAAKVLLRFGDALNPYLGPEKIEQLRAAAV